MSRYCDIAPGHPVHGPYHDREYGFPLDDEAALFERLSLEIFQAGLSWEIVLKKRQSTFNAFDGFNVDEVSDYGEDNVDRLLSDQGIIRNRLKILSVIENARRIKALRNKGGFAVWLKSHHPRDKGEWVKLFRKTFKFIGPEIVNEFMMSIGYLPGAHHRDCPVFDRITKLSPAWKEKTKN